MRRFGPAIAALALAACIPVKVPKGMLVTADMSPPGVKIDAVDGSFHIVPDVSFDTPFSVSNCSRINGGDWSAPGTNLKGIVGGFGAKPVRVTYPGLSEPLYGILALCMVDAKYHGPASRSYRIAVPEKFVKETEGGRVSTVFERYQVAGKAGLVDLPAWILWLSREPIP